MPTTACSSDLCGAMFGDECGVRWHCFRRLANQHPQSLQLTSDRIDRNDIGKWIIASGTNSLADEYRQPVGFDEQFPVLEGHASAALEQIDSIGQRFRDSHVAAILPQRSIVSGRGLVMQ